MNMMLVLYRILQVDVGGNLIISRVHEDVTTDTVSLSPVTFIDNSGLTSHSTHSRDSRYMLFVWALQTTATNRIFGDIIFIRQF